jgi:hypothetical protein
MKSLSIPHYGMMLILLICSIDFVMRLTPSIDTKNNQSEVGSMQTLNVAFLTKETASSLKGLLGQFDVVPIVVDAKKPTKQENTKPKVVLMSAQKQRLQSGVLNFFYDGEDKYQLTATFYDSKKRFVLLKKQHLPSKKITSLKLLEGDMVSVYKIEKIDRNFIVLSEQKRKIELQLFTKKSTQ